MSFLFAPAAGRGTFPPSADGESPAEVQRKTPRPERANTLTQFVCPGFPVQKRSRPDRANTLTQFAHPAQPVLKKLPRGSSPPLDFTLISYYTEKAKYVVPTTKQEEI
ncbi:hypothetical protein DW088_07380 [Butyricicoccus sp. AM05-1]|nr:hypothetical protein DW088_07380 [Butyricicoccus sp. AM05-1]